MPSCSASVAPLSPEADPLSPCDLISRRFHEALAEDSLFVFHRSQWNCLAFTFTQVLQHLRPILESASPASPSSLATTLHVLQEAMSEAERCMLDRSASLGRPVKHSWLLDKALKEVTATDVIDVHLSRFLWAFSITTMVADPVWRQANAVSSDFVQLIEALCRIWQGEDAKDDLSSCHDFFTTMNCEEDGKSCLLAQFIVEKILHRMQELDSAPSQDLPTYLWIDSNSHEPNSKAVGDGSNGKIYQTEWLGGLFAVKDFFRARSSLFAKEAAIQARARHPNVLTIVCCAKDTTSLHYSLLMELMQKDLYVLMLERTEAGISPPFSLRVALDLMLQIAQGMEYLHRLHIMHRDLKSMNVLVSFSGQTFNKSDDKDMNPLFTHLKVCDFGMSKAKLASDMYTSKPVGSPYWRAPEVFEQYQEGDTDTGRRRYTKKADVYSFGMVCYEILTGEIPYEGLNVTRSVLAGMRPTLPSNCPGALSCFIESCWHGVPSERPSFSEICSVLRFLKFCVLLQHDKGASLSHYLSQPLPPGLCASIKDMSESSTQSGGPHPLKIPSEMYCCGMLLQQSFASNEPTQRKPHGRPKLPTRFKARPNADRSQQSEHGSGKSGGKSQPFSLGWMQRLLKHTNKNPATSILAEGNVMDLVQSFSLSELNSATANFSQKIPAYGLGTFTYGRLENGREIAVKFLEPSSDRYASGELMNELRITSSLNHRNIVPLLGRCQAGESTYLIYEYMPHGRIGSHLFREEIIRPERKLLNLNWQQRFQICGQLASALKYLHEDARDFPIVHRTVMPRTVMLDSQLNARLRDCGSLSLIMTDDSGIDCGPSGYPGYMSPESFIEGRVSTATDIYAFGITVLNILTGRRVGFGSSGGKCLRDWVWQLYEKGSCHWMEAADPRMEGEFSEVEFKRLLLLALACTNWEPSLRPLTQALAGIISGTLQPLPIYAMSWSRSQISHLFGSVKMSINQEA